MTETGPEVVRVTPNRTRADEWALVLAAAGIACRLEWSLRGYALIVAADDAPAAARHLDAYDIENTPALAPAPPSEYGPTRAAAVAAGVLAGIFVLSGPRDDASRWFAIGAADAARIVTGEWWRTVTALTLHADFPHVLANGATLLMFGTGLCAILGPGVGLALMLAAGAAGNLLTAMLHRSGHTSVGASTAIFGAIGALAAVQIVRRRGGRHPRWRLWAPLAAGLGLLGFLGTSPQSDLFAHLFGFAAGAALGAAVAWSCPFPLPDRVQRALLLGAAAVVVGSWAIAYLQGG